MPSFGAWLYWLLTNTTTITSPRMPHCDLVKVENRLFNRYFDLPDNLFNKLTAEATLCTDFYSGNLPTGILNKTSYIVYGVKGSGKTALLKCHAQPTHQKWDVKLGDAEIREYTEQFAHSYHYDMTKISAAVGSHWTNEDFAHAVLASMARKLVTDVMTADKHTNTQVKARLQGLDAITKVALVDILCQYFPSAVVKDLQEFLNIVAPHTTEIFVWHWQSGSGGSYQQSGGNNIGQHDEFRAQWRAVKIRSEAAKTMTWNLVEQAHARFGNPPYTIQDAYSSIATLSRAVTAIFHKEPALIIDALDEIDGIFRREITHEVEVDALHKFIRSTMAPRLAAMMMTGDLFFFYSFPSDHLDFKQIFRESGLRTDKLAVVELRWSLTHIIAYADFHLQAMAKRQGSAKCADLPSFKELVRFNETSETIAKLRHPRDVNIFMQYLEIELNAGAEHRRYQPTADDVERAYNHAQGQDGMLNDGR